VVALNNIFDYELIRQKSLTMAKRLIYPVSETLPLLDPPDREKSVNEVVNRSLCIEVALACSVGCARNKAGAWILQEGLSEILSESESKFICDSFGYPPKFWDKAEALWAFVWSLGIIESLDYTKACSNDLVRMLPELKDQESSVAFRAKVNLRPMAEIIEALDLAYCLHWSVRDAEIRGQKNPGKVKPHVIVERRRALEWIVGSDDWDNVQLDT
jgi:Domain of unknown function (DUF4272)